VWRVRVGYTDPDTGKRTEVCKNFIRDEKDTEPSDEAIAYCMKLQEKHHGDFAKIN
jgi:hypothetical protein